MTAVAAASLQEGNQREVAEPGQAAAARRPRRRPGRRHGAGLRVPLFSSRLLHFLRQLPDGACFVVHPVQRAKLGHFVPVSSQNDLEAPSCNRCWTFPSCASACSPPPRPTTSALLPPHVVISGLQHRWPHSFGSFAAFVLAVLRHLNNACAQRN